MSTADHESQEVFDQRWKLEDMPACEEGMALLFRFSKAHPKEYATLKPNDLLDFRNSRFVGIMEWDNFVAHCSTCDHCNEV